MQGFLVEELEGTFPAPPGKRGVRSKWERDLFLYFTTCDVVRRFGLPRGENDEPAAKYARRRVKSASKTVADACEEAGLEKMTSKAVKLATNPKRMSNILEKACNGLGSWFEPYKAKVKEDWFRDAVSATVRIRTRPGSTN